MNCTDFENELIELTAARTRGLSEAARRHVATCADCRRSVNGDRALDRMIAAWRAATPAPTSRARLVTALLNDRPRAAPARSTPQRTPAAAWSLITVATVLMCLGVALWRDDDPRPNALVNRGPESSPVQALPISESVASLWDGMQSRSQQAAVETVRRLEEWPQVALHETIPAALPISAAEAANSPQSSAPWLQWGEPLGRQVGQAFQFLGDALPETLERPAG
ncbi:MAG: hypothetical protein SH850_06885 [Planctomycetaceae bacterium]|nr:hypothetical protein [Planctomycetaceae bacterium]